MGISHTHFEVHNQGATLKVHVHGQGKPLLLIHGFPDDSSVWRKQIPALVEAGFQVITPDTRGCGASSVPAEVARYHMQYLIADMVAVLDHLGISKAGLAGHDWGAAIAWQLALEHPDRFHCYAALSVGHPAAYAQGGLTQKLKSWYAVMFQARGIAEWSTRAGGWLALRVFTGHHPEFDHWVRLLSRTGRLTAGMNYYRANLKRMLTGRFGAIAVPTLGLWSEHDRYLTEKQMTASGDHAGAGFEYHRIHGASHWMQIDAPDKVNALLIPFFKQHCV